MQRPDAECIDQAEYEHVPTLGGTISRIRSMLLDPLVPLERALLVDCDDPNVHTPHQQKQTNTQTNKNTYSTSHTDFE